MDGTNCLIASPGKAWRGWPEGLGYLTTPPQIQRLQISGVVAEGLAVHQGGKTKIIQPQQPPSK